MSSMRVLAKALTTNYTQWNLPVKDKETFCALLLSRAIAFNLQLPSSAVESPLNYYNDNYSDLVHNLLSDVNDVQMIPFEATKALISKIWIFRYQLVYQPLMQTFDILNVLATEDTGLTTAAVTNFFETYKELKFTVSSIWSDAASLVNAEINGTKE